ncbi:exodeoxyribonuclease V subunit gamma [Thermoleophilia bacterium SCSIO 60948]|nr:exodeoxyribonuclease V subunit gamma [Thermoleophilia bacterium SCSIO 60948]
MLHVHRSERADALVDGLAELLSDPPEDPFATEVVAVPTRGMERWLTQRLSARLGTSDESGRRDGVCANVDFPFPQRLVESAIVSALGEDPDRDRWLPERAAWPLVDVINESMDEAWFEPVARHLRRDDGADSGRRFRLARHLADLFDRYGRHRPEIIAAWARGEEAETGHPAESWQESLWRRLADRLGGTDPVSRLEAATRAIESSADAVDLPERISFFGMTRVSGLRLGVLEAIAAHRDVNLFLLHPSPALWGRVADGPMPSEVVRSTDSTRALTSNRLLASWGQDAREMQLSLGAVESFEDRHLAAEYGATSMLERIQAGVRTDAPLSRNDSDGPPREPLDPADTSLRIHACHGPARQVEVLREAILHELERDPTLEPRDVIVMCPDIETFAPLIHATFGAGDVFEDPDLSDVATGDKPVDLKVRLADRALRQTNPILGVAARLIELGTERVTASQVLELADEEPVRSRFGFDDEALERIQSWISDAGIRWGLDARHRAPFKLDSLESGTWKAGLDRILLGVAMTEDELPLVGGVLPLDDVESGAIDLAGRLAEMVDRLESGLTGLAEPKPIAAWTEHLWHFVASMTRTRRRDAWQSTEFERLLEDLVEESAQDGMPSQIAISFGELKGLIADRLEGRPTRANFRTGHLTICTLQPMRSVPHRIVCLLGFDDGVFPRKSQRDGDDLLLADPRIGDPDGRLEDRQMLLDAMMAAEETLIVTYSGRDERTNLIRPPCVPVGELLDAVDATASVEDGRARDMVLVEHPLQPFDPRNFENGRIRPDTSWSFDRFLLDGAAQLSAGTDVEDRPFLDRPLSPVESRTIELDDLVRFVQEPVRQFLRGRLGINLRSYGNEVEDRLPIDLDGLGRWGIGEKMLEGLLSGASPRAVCLAEIARGGLPPQQLGKAIHDGAFTIAERIYEAVSEADPSPPTSTEARVELADGRTVAGTVTGIRGKVVTAASYSSLKPKNRIGAWVRLLALLATDPDRDLTALTAGKSGNGASAAVISSLGDDPETRRETALSHLEAIVAIYDRGLTEPLPIYCSTSAAYAVGVYSGEAKKAYAAARKAWTSGYNSFGEDDDAEHEFVLGGRVGFDDLLGPPDAGDVNDRPGSDEETRFGLYAVRLWDGLLAREQVKALI